MDNSIKELIKTLEKWFSAFPPLPKNVKEIIVKFFPWISLIIGILGVLSSIQTMISLASLAPWAAAAGVYNYSFGSGIIMSLFWLASSVLMIIAYPGLNTKKAKGWNCIFWSEIISLLGFLVSAQIFQGVISALIGFYFLFQIKSYYK